VRKWIAVLMITAAWAILFGHNIISHHHHEHEEELTAHYHSHHDHEDDETGNDFSHFFSHFLHAGNDVTFTSSTGTNTFSKKVASAVLPDIYFSSHYDIPPLLNSPPAEHLIYFSPHSHTAGLRAPPSL
jgi:hypothetical protein